jgi:hypothetical protein
MSIRHALVFRLGAACAVAATALVAGCQATATAEEEPAEIEPMVQQDPPVNLMSGIDSDAVEVARGTGFVTYTAESTGKVQLYNRTTNELVDDFNVSSGDTLIVDGQSGRATLSGNDIILKKPVTPENTYIVYLRKLAGESSDAPQQRRGAGFRIVPEGDLDERADDAARNLADQ